MTIARRPSPLGELVSLRQAMDRLFEDSFVRPGRWAATGVGSDSQRPFALVIVSGLFSRLLISVFLMPALYAIVSREGDRLEV